MVGLVAVVAIAVAAPYLAPLALGALGITATATAVAIATAVITIGLSLAVSFAFRALGIGAPSAKDQVGPPQVFRQTISNSFIVYGKRRVGGLLVFFHAKQGSDGAHYRYFVIAVAGHQCLNVVQWLLNDESVTVAGDGTVTSGKYAGNAWLDIELGAGVFATLHSVFVAECDGKWTDDHVGNGVTKIYAKFRLTDDVVQAGMPNITGVINGKTDIHDPRDGTTNFNDNAALVFYNWMQMPREEGGYGAYADEIPDASWISAQANVCAETVNGASRYAINAVIQTGASPGEVRDVMVVSQAGTYTYSGGKHLMRPGYWVPPSATLAEVDLAGPIQVSPFVPADAAATEVQGTYISPDTNYTAAPLTTWSVTPTPDDVRQVDIDLAFVTNKDQGDRVLRIMGKRAQCEKTVTWPENIVGLKRRAMDTVQVDKADYGLSNYAWTITTWQFAADFGAVMNLREENAEIYDDEAAVAPATPPTIASPDPILTQAQTIALINGSKTNGLSFSVADNGDITISNHFRLYDDKTVPVTGGTVPHASGAVTGDIEEVYYDDPARAGGAVTYHVLRLPGGVGDDSSAFASQTNPYRHNVLAAHVAASGTTTSGGSDVGSGGGAYSGYSGHGQIP